MRSGEEFYMRGEKGEDKAYAIGLVLFLGLNSVKVLGYVENKNKTEVEAEVEIKVEIEVEGEVEVEVETEFGAMVIYNHSFYVLKRNPVLKSQEDMHYEAPPPLHDTYLFLYN